MKVWFVTSAVAALALAGCDAGNTKSNESGGQPLPATEAAAEAATPEPPTPNYVEYRKGVYYYASEVSENDKKNGKAAGEVHGFRYLGKNADGEMVLAVADAPSVKFTCTDPCRVIHQSTGQDYSFEPTSVIGGVFADAMNGLLKVDKRK